MQTEQVLEIEAESLEEARKMAQARIPKGFHMLSEKVLLDGKPPIKNKQTIEVEAGTIEEAIKQAKSGIPKGLQLLSEHILSDGMPIKVKAMAETAEAAFEKAQNGISSNLEVIEKKELITPERKIITVEAFDESMALSNAKWQLREYAGTNGRIKGVKLVSKGASGFLGIGKKSNRYEVECFRDATVEVTCKPKAKIAIEIGEVGQKTKTRIIVKIGMTEKHRAKLLAMERKRQAELEEMKRTLPSRLKYLQNPKWKLNENDVKVAVRTIGEIGSAQHVGYLLKTMGKYRGKDDRYVGIRIGFAVHSALEALLKREASNISETDLQAVSNLQDVLGASRKMDQYMEMEDVDEKVNFSTIRKLARQELKRRKA